VRGHDLDDDEHDRHDDLDDDVDDRAVMRSVEHGLPLKRRLRVGPAEIAYVESGDDGAAPVVLLHGFPTHSYLWRHVMYELGDRVHALAPDLLGLGDTTVSPYEDFSAPMQAELLLEWLDRLGLDAVALVAHDMGGAVAQQLVANHPERVTHLALVNSVAYNGWPSPFVQSIMRVARTPGFDTIAYALDLTRRVAHSTRLGFARALHDPARIDASVIDEYLRPITTVEGRERARRFVLAADARFTTEAVSGLRAFAKPALVAWGADDVFLSPSWGLRLVDDLPGADRLELLPFCGHLVPEERPAELAALLHSLLERS
jgi:pimeloyl-ACP methyl ester carboxylesterase